MSIFSAHLTAKRTGATLASLATLALAPAAFADEIVEINRTHVLKLPRPAAAVLIGDPEIADVSVFSDTTLFLLGRGYGETDLVIMDAGGNVMLETNVVIVDPPESSRVNLITGNQGRESYHCRPYCRPAPRKGDDPRFRNAYGPTGTQASGVGATITESQDQGEVPQGGSGTAPAGTAGQPLAGGNPAVNNGPF